VADYADRHAYSTAGMKKAVSNIRSYSMGRSSSCDTVATSYTSDVQMRMMNSFSTGIPNDNGTSLKLGGEVVVGDQNVDISKGSNTANPVVDDDRVNISETISKKNK
jgi:hypothetical protein